MGHQEGDSTWGRTCPLWKAITCVSPHTDPQKDDKKGTISLVLILKAAWARLSACLSLSVCLC